MATTEEAPRTAKLTEEDIGRGEFVAYLRRQHTRRGGQTFAYVESASNSPTVHWLRKKTGLDLTYDGMHIKAWGPGRLQRLFLVTPPQWLRDLERELDDNEHGPITPGRVLFYLGEL